MNYLQKNFIYLSQIIDISVIDLATNKKIGYVADVAASLREMYPRISSLVVRKKLRRSRFLIPWKNIRKIVEDKTIFVEGAEGGGEKEARTQDNEILLKETFWDKQIVDISGSKVVRVNDLHLLRENSSLWVVHIDVGFRGLLRRLGWSGFFEFIIRWLFSYELKDRLVPWKFVQPITTDKGSELLSLKTPGMRLSELHPADLADILIDLGTEERVVFLKTLNRDIAAGTLKELPTKIRVQTAELIDQQSLASILNEMPVDEVVDLLLHFHSKKINALLNLLPPGKAESIRKLLELSERVAGSLMNVEFVSVHQSMTTGQALEKVRAELKSKESVYYVYVLDDAGTLVGVVTLRQLLMLPADKLIADFMRKRVTKVKVDTDIKKVPEIFFKYDFTVIPVVDKQNKLQGIITMKDAFESVFPEIREETEEIK